MITTPINNRVLVSMETLNAHRVLALGVKTDLAAGAQLNYDMVVTLQAAHSAEYADEVVPPAFDITLWDLTQTEVKVLVLDTDATSATKDYYVDAAAVAVVGIKEDGKIRIVNQHSALVSLMVQVIVHRKPITVTPAPV
jgi:hypothetical protein